MIYTDGEYLVSDKVTKLHDFAYMLGLERDTFIWHDRHPHYKIEGAYIDKAIMMGANLIPRRNLILFCQEHYGK